MPNPAVLLFLLAPVALAAVKPGRGVPMSLAEDRAAHIRNLRYELRFRIPESTVEKIRGDETIRFDLAAPHGVVLDFEQPRDRIISVDKPFEFVNGHLVIPASA